jgi:lipid-A-disaccharide synthase-like uncharacterized protein
MNFWIQFALVAFAMAIADWCWTKYMLHAAAHRAVPAAFWSMAIIGVSAFSVTSYVEDKRLILAALIGAWIGTYYAVVHTKKGVDSEEKEIV